jgi:uncharacterized membrane protein
VNTGLAQLQVLLTCFDSHEEAGRVHHPLSREIKAGGATIFDEAVLKIMPNGKVRVYDPRRTIAGTVTPAVTWGVLGLLAGGGNWLSLVIWAIIGGLCGGLFSYFSKQLIANGQLGQLGKRLAPDSSAVLSFIGETEATQLAAVAAPFKAASTSVVTIQADLSATALSDAAGDSTATSKNTLLNMLLYRYPGKDTARGVSAAASVKSTGVEAALLIHADSTGKLRVANPHAKALVRSDVAGWGVLGLVVGAAAGFGGSGGLFGVLERSVITGLVWAVFGLLAGSLYGLWAARAVSARRLSSVRPLVPPNTSLLLAWAEGDLTPARLSPWTVRDSRNLILKFVQTERGAALTI